LAEVFALRDHKMRSPMTTPDRCTPMMVCAFCGDDAQIGVPLFRQNPKGQRGIWACKEHSRAPIDPMVEQITSCIARYKGR
jgi:hypothetical protein